MASSLFLSVSSLTATLANINALESVRNENGLGSATDTSDNVSVEDEVDSWGICAKVSVDDDADR